jgi:hypothetical protein
MGDCRLALLKRSRRIPFRGIGRTHVIGS